MVPPSAAFLAGGGEFEGRLAAGATEDRGTGEATAAQGAIFGDHDFNCMSPAQAISKRSAFITLFHAATKSLTNFGPASLAA
jgi:hypothetical protein